MIAPEYFLHASNITRVLSFSAKDILWLRILAVCSSLVGMPYFYLRDQILWEPILWASVFILINGYHVWRLWRERQPVQLSNDETKLYDLTFFPLTRRQFKDLARIGRWTNLNPGDMVIHRGQTTDQLAVPLTDGIEGKVSGRSLGRFAPGAIVGASAMFEARPSQLEAIAAESCRVLLLPADVIKDRARKNAQLSRTLERIAREDLARKLELLVGITADLPRRASQPDQVRS